MSLFDGMLISLRATTQLGWVLKIPSSFSSKHEFEFDRIKREPFYLIEKQCRGSHTILLNELLYRGDRLGRTEGLASHTITL